MEMGSTPAARSPGQNPPPTTLSDLGGSGRPSLEIFNPHLDSSNSQTKSISAETNKEVLT